MNCRLLQKNNNMFLLYIIQDFHSHLHLTPTHQEHVFIIYIAYNLDHSAIKSKYSIKKIYTFLHSSFHYCLINNLKIDNRSNVLEK
jgi:hypothetical protein